MKNNQKGFIIPLVIAIIAILAIGAGVYVYKDRESETSNDSNSQLVAYNSSLGFSISYPKKWKVVVPEEYRGKREIFVAPNEPSSNVMGGIEVTVESVGYDYAAYKNLIFAQLSSSKPEEISLNGEKAVKVHYSVNGLDKEQIGTVKNGKRYVFIYTESSIASNRLSQSVVNSILATFKF